LLLFLCASASANSNGLPRLSLYIIIKIPTLCWGSTRNINIYTITWKWMPLLLRNELPMNVRREIYSFFLSVSMCLVLGWRKCERRKIHTKNFIFWTNKSLFTFLHRKLNNSLTSSRCRRRCVDFFVVCCLRIELIKK